jgi:hypothetical protein
VEEKRGRSLFSVHSYLEVFSHIYVSSMAFGLSIFFVFVLRFACVCLLLLYRKWTE